MAANRKRPRFVGVWLSENGFQTIADLAEDEHRTRSDMIRVLLIEAVEARRKVRR